MGIFLVLLSEKTAAVDDGFVFPMIHTAMIRIHTLQRKVGYSVDRQLAAL